MQALHGWLLLLCIYFADKSKLGLWFKWLLQVVLSTTRQFFVFCPALGTAQSCLWLGLLCAVVLKLLDVRSNAYLELKPIVLPYYTLTTVFLSMLISRACILQTHNSALFFTAVNCEVCGVFVLFCSGFFFWLSLLLKPLLSKCLESAMWCRALSLHDTESLFWNMACLKFPSFAFFPFRHQTQSQLWLISVQNKR